MPAALRKLFLLLWLVLPFCRSCRKQDPVAIPTAPVVLVATDLVYGTAINALGAAQKLRFDWYRTRGAGPQPTLVLLHGGDFRTGNKTALAELCRLLAFKGFTVLNISYRQGLPDGACGGNAYTLGQALYRSVQDVHTALGFAARYADSLRIDTAQVFVGGAGAGAMAALGAAFTAQQAFNKLFPGVERDLGPLLAAGMPPYCRIRGVVNIAGGLLGAAIPAAAALPVIGFYNQADWLVPGYAGRFNRCNNYPKVFGPQYLYQQLAAKPTAAVLHQQGKDASWNMDDAYLADNIACFIKAVLQGRKPKGVFANTITLCP